MTTPIRRHAHVPVGSADVLPRLAAAAWSDRVALRAGDRALSFAALDRDISRLAFGLRQWLGGDGLPVVVSAVPGVAFPVALYAVLRSGNVAAPVNPRMPAATFARLLASVRPCAVVLARAMYERVRPVLAEQAGLEQVILLDGSANGRLTCAELAARGGLLVEPRDRDERSPAVLTGDRVLTHHEVKARAYALAATDGLGVRSVVLNATPAYRVDHLGAGLAAGATQVLFANPDPAAAVRAADRAGATHLCLPGYERAHTVPDNRAVAS
jgi:acyl-CoA synthetase (AMP-forming)/AMP-acid ligase II